MNLGSGLLEHKPSIDTEALRMRERLSTVGIKASGELFGACSGCQACGLCKGDAVYRLRLTLRRDEEVAEFDVCSATSMPTPQNIAESLAFLSFLPEDADELRSDEGFIRPRMAVALAEQSRKLRAFFNNSAEHATLRTLAGTDLALRN